MRGNALSAEVVAVGVLIRATKPDNSRIVGYSEIIPFVEVTIWRSNSGAMSL
jgi:hypothetical protein